LGEESELGRKEAARKGDLVKRRTAQESDQTLNPFSRIWTKCRNTENANQFRNGTNGTALSRLGKTGGSPPAPRQA